MKIYGNTVGTTLPKPNFDQTDPKKGDFIKGDRTFLKGENGAVFVPEVSGEGILSWTNNGGLPNPEPVDIVGEDGYTPIKGTDYYTDSDKEEMVVAVLDNIPRATHISVDRLQRITTMNLTMNDGTSSAVRIEYDDSGDPTSITVDGEQITLEFIYHTMQLFLNGNTYLDNSGGWTANGKAKGAVTEQKTPTLDVSSDMTISLTTDKNSAQGSVMSGHTILYPDNWSKLCFVVKSLSSDGKVTFGLTADKSGSTYTMVNALDAALGLNEISLADIDAGNHYIAIAVTAYAGKTTSAVIESIYLE